MSKLFKNIGPGTLIAAAFIGPGTVTLCTLAGVQFGYNLLWAMTLSIVATIILQEMAARVGIITQKGLAEVIKSQVSSPLLRTLVLVLILSAIVVGNGAYEAGNISGSSLGLTAIFGSKYSNTYPVIIGLIAFVILLNGNYKKLERYLIVLVLIMSLAFITAAILTKPNLELLLKGMFVPKFPDNSLLTVVGLIGTTVVPYNLFLHASLVKERWKKKSDLKYARKDIFVSIILGGLVSMAIIVSAAAIGNNNITSVLDLAKGIEPVYGNAAKYFVGIGLFAAGITSSITAPLAAAYVAKSCFGWQADLKDIRFRTAWFIILILGVGFSFIDYSPIQIIKFAQISNGILLPIIALFLFWIVNNSTVLGKYKNGILLNIVSIFIILIAVILGVKSVLKVLELL